MLIPFILYTAIALETPAPTVTQAEVLAMMSAIPPAEVARKGAPPAHWEHQGDAAEVAQGIADAVNLDASGPLLESARVTAGLMAVYAAWEGGNRRCVAGDHGKSLGVFQLQNATPETACSPARAARVWLARAHSSSELCAGNEPDERLASLASGRCDWAKKKVRLRVELARVIADLPEE